MSYMSKGCTPQNAHRSLGCRAWSLSRPLMAAFQGHPKVQVVWPVISQQKDMQDPGMGPDTPGSLSPPCTWFLCARRSDPGLQSWPGWGSTHRGELEMGSLVLRRTAPNTREHPNQRPQDTETSHTDHACSPREHTPRTPSLPHLEAPSPPLRPGETCLCGTRNPQGPPPRPARSPPGAWGRLGKMGGEPLGASWAVVPGAPGGTRAPGHTRLVRGTPRASEKSSEGVACVYMENLLEAKKG